MPTLYNLVDQFQELANYAASSDPQVFNDTLESIGLSEDLDKKIEAYMQVVKTLEGDSKQVTDEIKRLQARRKSYDNNIRRLKNNLLNAMRITNKKRVKTPLFTVSTRTIKSVEIINEADLDNKYYKQQPAKIDKLTLKEDLKNGVPVKGATLIENKSLNIR